MTVSSPNGSDDNCKIKVHVEVQLKPRTGFADAEVRQIVNDFFASGIGETVAIPCDLTFDLASQVSFGHCFRSVLVCEADGMEPNSIVQVNKISWDVHVYELHESPPRQIMQEENVASYTEWSLPHRDFDGIWESLVFESDEHMRLLKYLEAGLLMDSFGIDKSLVTWNRVLLLHGEPGSGKTSLCKALAQKVSFRFKSRFKSTKFIEINAHSLFSRWFSESGKMVGKMFDSIKSHLKSNTLVCILIDEVESLAAARNRSSSDPSDAIRVVNALLTQLDQLKKCDNVVVMATSNLSGCIDLAFVDRADIKMYMGPPGPRASYTILCTCLEEMMKKKMVVPDVILSPLDIVRRMSETGASTPKYEDEDDDLGFEASRVLWDISNLTTGMSGRDLRKLPFLATTVAMLRPDVCSTGPFNVLEFMDDMKKAAECVIKERAQLKNAV